MVDKKQIEMVLTRTVMENWESIKNSVWWTDHLTFTTFIPLNDELRKAIRDEKEFWEDVDGTLNAMFCEYWTDENKFVYVLPFDLCEVDIAHKVQCDYLDGAILKLVKMTQ